MKGLLEQVVAGRSLTREQAREVFERVLSGAADPAWVGALLGALATRGETVEELTGAAEAMRRLVQPVRCDAEAVDTCGTGGDGISTFNVSTTAAIIAAAAGVTVAKHGNRSHTRVSGSAEVLEMLGVNIHADVATVERCLREHRIGFLFAPSLHPAMRHAGPIRAALGIRTIFNLLGPLANPAGVRRQIIGVPRPRWMEMLATVLRELGSVHVWVVHGADGLCDLSVTGPSEVVELREGVISSFVVEPGDCGLQRGRLDDLLVRSPRESADRVLEVLGGKPGTCRDQALLNAGAALAVGGRAADLHDGVRRAAEAVDSGAAAQTLRDLARTSNAKR